MTDPTSFKPIIIDTSHRVFGIAALLLSPAPSSVYFVVGHCRLAHSHLFNSARGLKCQCSFTVILISNLFPWKLFPSLSLSLSLIVSRGTQSFIHTLSLSLIVTLQVFCLAFERIRSLIRINAISFL